MFILENTDLTNNQLDIAEFECCYIDIAYSTVYTNDITICDYIENNLMSYNLFITITY